MLAITVKPPTASTRLDFNDLLVWSRNLYGSAMESVEVLLLIAFVPWGRSMDSTSAANCSRDKLLPVSFGRLSLNQICELCLAFQFCPTLSPKTGIQMRFIYLHYDSTIENFFKARSLIISLFLEISLERIDDIRESSEMITFGDKSL